jgi:hypothetical protein
VRLSQPQYVVNFRVVTTAEVVWGVASQHEGRTVKPLDCMRSDGGYTPIGCIDESSARMAAIR